jgi:ornithine carbamoyltransferase
MISTLQTRRHSTSAPMSPRQTSAVLAQARALQRAARAGTTQPLLKGKKLGLLCGAADDSDALPFRQAAQELGAYVAHIRPSLSDDSTTQEVAHITRMPGRLYDAVECQGITPALVSRMGRDAGVPVFGGIATAAHATARLAEPLEGVPVDNRRFILQAVPLIGIA